MKILADKIPNFSEVSEDICWQDPKFQLEYPVLKTLWPRPSLSIDIVTSIFMLILRRSTPNSSHHMVVHGSSRLSDNTLLLWDQVVGDRLCWFLPTKSTQKLRNTLVSVYYELIISSHCDELWEPKCTIAEKGSIDRDKETKVFVFTFMAHSSSFSRKIVWTAVRLWCVPYIT